MLGSTDVDVDDDNDNIVAGKRDEAPAAAAKVVDDDGKTVVAAVGPVAVKFVNGVSNNDGVVDDEIVLLDCPVWVVGTTR